MKPKQAKKQFQQRLDQDKRILRQLTPAVGIAAMLDFYREERASDCAEDEGDMLLYQWGAQGPDGEQWFRLEIVRQFMQDNDDETVSQLGLSFRFPLSPQLLAAASGNVWCSAPSDLAEFKAAIENHAAFREQAQATPQKVLLDYEKT